MAPTACTPGLGSEGSRRLHLEALPLALALRFLSGLLTSGAGSTTLAFVPPVLPPSCLDGVFWRKSEILWTRKSRSFRLANRKVILLLVLIDRGLGSTLELSAFSTMVT